MKFLAVFRALPFALLFFGAILSASANETTRQVKLAKFIDFWGIPEMVKRYRENCLEPFQETTPEKTYKADPGFFWGMSPHSQFWPKVVAAYWRYAEASCSSLKEEGVKAKHLEAWGTRLTERDLDALLKFLSSNAGHAYIRGHKGVTDELLDYYAETVKAGTKHAYDKYLKEMSAIAQEFDESDKGKVGREGK